MSYFKDNIIFYGVTAWVAQWIEQKFPKLLVGGSIPLPGTNLTASALTGWGCYFIRELLLGKQKNENTYIYSCLLRVDDMRFG